ncbi:MAG: SufD family Fe-S cluster assembly protein [Firmicutes bacterium]|nr:SufD family Fe-S cluster assembly protein [Bacillota bacterium]
MQKVLNKPLTNTFGWLHMNGTSLEIPEETEEKAIVLSPSEEKQLILDDACPNRALHIEVQEGAVLKLIQISRSDERGIHHIEVQLQKNGRFEWYRLILGSAAVYDDCKVTLIGDDSSFTARIGYDLKAENRMDMNCEAVHLGKRTTSNIKALGVLDGQAFKLLRGTIDLRTGCKGAKGDEYEDVLLLSDDVHNQSIPMILCSEEDVEGNHGATIGQLPEELIYYMTSRGIEKDDLYTLMARSRLDSIIQTLPDEALREALLSR